MKHICKRVIHRLILIYTVIAQIIKKRRRNEPREAHLKEPLFALHSFTPAKDGSAGQLAFAEGDELTLYSDADANWWLVKHNLTGKKGYVPMSHVARKSEQIHMEWYDLSMTREGADRILREDKYKPGSFLIRTVDNRHFSQALTLTVKTSVEDETYVLHYRINREDGQFRIEGGRAFPSLAQLVQFYAGHNSGLKQPLTFSVKRRDTLNDEWEIFPNDVIFDEDGERLESTFIAEIFKGSLFGRAVAVKTKKTGMMITIKQFMEEANIAREFSHKNIVTTLGVCSEKPYIITEFLPGGNLKDYIRKAHVPDEDYLLIAQKIASAMVYLEERGIVHRDLAARTILVGQTHDVIKLADFGLARCLDNSVYFKTANEFFPYKWTAPEAFLFNESQQVSAYTTASDVWSFGVVLWELYSKGAEPYNDMFCRQINDEIVHNNYRLLCPTSSPPVLYEMMLECWNLDPIQRPTFAQLHDFLLRPYGDEH